MATQQPTYHAWTGVKREGKDDFWVGPIGAAFSHQDGQGLNIVLQALPLPGADGQCKLVLRVPKQSDEPQAAKDNVRPMKGRRDR